MGLSLALLVCGEWGPFSKGHHVGTWAPVCQHTAHRLPELQEALVALRSNNLHIHIGLHNQQSSDQKSATIIYPDGCL